MSNLNEAKFSVDVTGEVTGKPWKGVFKTKIRLSHRDQLRQDEIRRELIGKNPEGASPRAQNTADVFAFVLVHLLETPQWWSMAGNGLDLEDDNVIADVYGKIVDIKVEAQKKLKEDAEAAKAELEKEKKTQ
jgi:hypothetical protein